MNKRVVFRHYLHRERMRFGSFSWDLKNEELSWPQKPEFPLYVSILDELKPYSHYRCQIVPDNADTWKLDFFNDGKTDFHYTSVLDDLMFGNVELFQYISLLPPVLVVIVRGYLLSPWCFQ